MFRSINPESAASVLISLQGLECIHVRIRADAWFGGRAVTREAGTALQPYLWRRPRQRNGERGGDRLPVRKSIGGFDQMQPKY